MREPYETLLGQYRDHWALWPFLEGEDPDFPGMLDSSAFYACSTGEQIMICVALAIWNGDRRARVAELKNLDEENRSRVLVALAGVLAS